MTVYKVWDKANRVYLSLSYSQKNSWQTFPSSAIKNSQHVSALTEKNRCEVHQFELTHTRTLTLNKKEI